jgi:arginase
MPCAVAVGYGPRCLVDMGVPGPHVDPSDVVLIGIRDVDATEKDLVWKSGVRVYTMRDVDQRGLGDIMHEAIRHLKKDTVGYHVTLDADGLDPEVAPGVGTPVKGGISYREGHLMMEILAEAGGMLGLEIAEVNPLLDENNRTAEMLVELSLSAFGKTIL